MDCFKSIQRNKKDILALLAFSVLVIAYFWKIIFLKCTFLTQDLCTFYFPIVVQFSKMLKLHTVWFWDPWIFSGFPFIANVFTGLFYPLNWLCLFMPVPQYLVFDLILHCFLGGVFMYFFIRSIKQPPISALIAALIFTFAGSSMMSNIGGTQPKHTEIWLPLVLLLSELSITTRRKYLSLLLGVALALQFFAGHTFISVFIFIFFIYYYVFRSYFEIRKEGRVIIAKLVKGFSLAVLIGLGLWAIQLIPALEMSRLSFRGQGLSQNEIFYPGGSLSLLSFVQFFVPDFFGSIVNSTNWSVGNSGYAAWGYIGIFPVVLIILTFKRPFSIYQKIFLSFAVFALITALGEHSFIYLALIKIIPYFSAFRGPAKILYLYFFCMCVLSGIAITDVLARGYSKKRLKIILIGLFVLAGMIILAIAWYHYNAVFVKNALNQYIVQNLAGKPGHPYSLQEYMNKGVRVLRNSEFIFFRTSGIILLIAIWIYLYARKHKWKRGMLFILVGVLFFEFYLAKRPFVQYCSD